MRLWSRSICAMSSQLEAPPETDHRPDVDLLDPGFYIGDPHAAYTWMRANEPLYRDAINGIWAVTRHADIHEVEGDASRFVSGRGYRSMHSPTETNMIAQDDPRHLEQRRLVNRGFTPRAVRDHESWIRSTVTELVDAFIDGDEVEVVDALGAQLACRLTARLLGWPEERWPAIKSWSERLMHYDRILVDPKAGEGMVSAIMEFITDLQPMVEERRGCPMDDLVSVWANAGMDDHGYDFETIMHEVGLFISGGAETTRTVITRGLRTFCDHPDQWELLAREPQRIPGAVDELVRWVTPLHNFFRTAVLDTTVGGTPVAEGDRFMLLYASGNRDETVFDDPFRFDVTRTPNNHVGFGHGTHYCLGANLAKLELRIVLEELTSRLTDLHVVAETVDEPHVFAWAVESFGLGFTRR